MAFTRTFTPGGVNNLTPDARKELNARVLGLFLRPRHGGSASRTDSQALRRELGAEIRSGASDAGPGAAPALPRSSPHLLQIAGGATDGYYGAPQLVMHPYMQYAGLQIAPQYAGVAPHGGGWAPVPMSHMQMQPQFAMFPQYPFPVYMPSGSAMSLPTASGLLSAADKSVLANEPDASYFVTPTDPGRKQEDDGSGTLALPSIWQLAQPAGVRFAQQITQQQPQQQQPLQPQPPAAAPESARPIPSMRWHEYRERR